MRGVKGLTPAMLAEAQRVLGRGPGVLTGGELRDLLGPMEPGDRKVRTEAKAPASPKKKAARKAQKAARKTTRRNK